MHSRLNHCTCPKRAPSCDDSVSVARHFQALPAKPAYGCKPQQRRRNPGEDGRSALLARSSRRTADGLARYGGRKAAAMHAAVTAGHRRHSRSIGLLTPNVPRLNTCVSTIAVLTSAWPNRPPVSCRAWVLPLVRPGQRHPANARGHVTSMAVVNTLEMGAKLDTPEAGARRRRGVARSVAARRIGAAERRVPPKD
jgi:hypothetical protein